MAVNLSSLGGAGWQFFDNNGVILSGGKIYSYEAGTTTPAITYTSSIGSTPHSNPIILDSTGRVPGGEIWLTAGNNFKFILTTSLDVILGTYDNVGAIASGEGTVQNFSGNGSQTAFTLSVSPQSENSTNIYINGIYQQKNTFSVVSNVITFSEAPPAYSNIEVVCF